MKIQDFPRVCVIAILTFGVTAGVEAATLVDAKAVRYVAEDTLVAEAEAGTDADAMLSQFRWQRQAFEVAVIDDPAGSLTLEGRLKTDASALAVFPSPLPREDGEAVNRVVMEWFAAEGLSEGETAPAVLVLDILDGRMMIARAFARALSQQGIHAFAMHMPSYGWRQMGRWPLDGELFVELCVQAVGDARRARDAIAVLPGVDHERISIQGTSLGGFIASAAAAVDPVFENAFLMLAGGNLYDLLHNGEREAQMIRRALEDAGFAGEMLRELCARIEPTRLAHRLDPGSTWLFSARADQVVPAENARALADAAALEEGGQHFWLMGDHYSALLNMPWAARMMGQTIRAAAVPETSP